MKLGVRDEDTLFGRASRALGWSFFSTVFGKIGLVGFGILLARLLGPQQFGTAAVAIFTLLAVTSFNDLGVSLAIVRWPGEPSEIAATVVTISVASSLLLYIGLFLGAPTFAAALGAPAATSVVRVLALSIVTNGVVAVPAALLERYFRQDRKTIADQVHGWLSVGLSVILAWAGFGAMSIAIGQVAGAIAGGTLITIFAPLPLRVGFDTTKARKLVKFGLPLAGSAFIVFLVANVDNLVAGHLLGATALGFYVLAWNLASFPVNMFSAPVRTVATALFSRLQHDPVAMRTTFTSAVALLGSVTLPVCLLISGSAVPLINFVYGPKWVPAAQALVWLALLGALRILFELTYDYFVVLAKSRVVFTVQLAWLLALIPSLIVGARLGGIGGVAIAGVVVAAVVVLPWYLTELSKVGIKLRSLAVLLWLPLAAAVAVGFVAWAAAKAIPSEFTACAAGGVVALITIGLLVFKVRSAIAELRTASGSPQDGSELAIARDDAHAIRPKPTNPPLLLRKVAPSRSPDPALQAAAIQALIAIASSPVPFHDMTGPLPVYRDAARVLPVYEDVVAVMGWDPIAGRRSSHVPKHDRRVKSTAGGPR